MTTSLKTCFKCNTEKPLTEFYKHSEMADGHLNKCKKCTKIDTRRNRADRSEYYRDYDQHRAMQPDRVAARYQYSQTEAGKAAAIRAKQVFKARHPQKRKAHIAVGNALASGKLKRQPCIVCGKKAQGHHEDYNKPLDVTWLCTFHHALRHKILRGTYKIAV